MTKFENDVDEFVKLLADFDTKSKLTNVFNPWRDDDPEYDIDKNSPIIRCNNLREYLISRKNAQYVLIAEAPGYQGCHFSGIPMTSERLIITKAEEYSLINIYRTSDINKIERPIIARNNGFCEPTATVVWKQMVELMNATDFVLWNTFPFHPYKNNNLLTNRTPRKKEIEETKDILNSFLALFPNNITRIAVGQKAQQALGEQYFNDNSFIQVRHPANGGANEFREGIKHVLITN